MTPDKDPQLWVLLTPEWLQAALMATIITFIRAAYDDKEPRWQRRLLESLLCGFITYGVSAGLSYFQMSAGVSIFAGAMIGFLGADAVRGYTRRYISNKISKDNTEEK